MGVMSAHWKMIWIDFETKSRCDLLTAGVYNYAQDLSTEVLCMAYAHDNEDVQVWLPGQPLPDFGGEQIRAHNAAFERLIFWYVLQQDYPLEQFYCTAAQSRANCAPGSLEDAGRFAGASMRKDHRGAQLIRLLSVPRADGTFNQDPDLHAEMVRYCVQDVRAMRAISLSQRQLTAEELSDYHINERINDRGVLVDVELAKAATRYADAELLEVQALVKDITKGEVTTVRSPTMKKWVQERVGPQALKLMTQDDGKTSVDKSVRANLLALADENPDEVPCDVADVLQCASDIWASSVAKFQRMADLADVEDHRVRGAFVFNGGGATGRASSYGLQVHNLGRKVSKTPVETRTAMVQGDRITNVSDTLKGMVRPAMVPAPGHVFVVADWAGIEARVNPWMSGYGDSVLDVFRQGKDIYIREAAGIFRCAESEVDPPRRTIGKVAILALGYGGGPNAFASMGRIYGVRLAESEVIRTVNAWRKANQWAVNYWQQLERAYTRAMRHKGYDFAAGRTNFLFDGQHLWYSLPSGRILCYPYARFEGEGITYAKCAWKPKATDSEWPRARLWHGISCIAKGTPVLTDSGWIAIDQVPPTARVWDGEDWVHHSGVAHQGAAMVGHTYGVATTSDHLILTTEGWKPAEQIQGHDRATCRLPDGFEESSDRPGSNFTAEYYAEVYDLTNCGPRRRFVVRGVNGELVTVHNCENLTQAVANDLLRHSLRQVKDGVVLHVHDEIVVECPKAEADSVVENMRSVMCTPPEWAPDLPLAVEIKVMDRYGK